MGDLSGTVEFHMGLCLGSSDGGASSMIMFSLSFLIKLDMSLQSKGV